MANREFENIDLSSICLETPYVQDDIFAAVGANPPEVKAGTVLGRVTSDQKLVACDLSETNGSQIPIAVVQYDFKPAAPGDVSIRPVLGGMIRADKTFFAGSPTTPLTKIQKDLLRKVGIQAVDVDQLGQFNNPGAV
jgi:hypothetical protein